MPRATIFIADANALARLGLRTVLHSMEALEALEVVGEAIDDLETIERIRALRPSLALISLHLPAGGGLEVVARVRQVANITRCVLIADDVLADPQNALDLGAAGFAVAAGDSSEVQAAIRAVLAGNTYVSPTAGRPSEPRRSGAGLGGFSSLSPRQREVLRLIAQGASTREIAEQLERSVKTIETHRAQVMKRLEVDSVADLVKAAIRAGLVPLRR